MSVPYEPVIRHEWPHFGNVCGPCMYATANKPCGKDWCRCICNGMPPALMQEPVNHPERDPAEWEEPPAKPEEVGTWWVPGPLTIPSPDEWVTSTVEKSDNKVDFLPFALLILALNVIGLVLVADTDRSIKAVLIVSATCAAILALLSIQREKE